MSEQAMERHQAEVERLDRPSAAEWAERLRSGLPIGSDVPYETASLKANPNPFAGLTLAWHGSADPRTELRLPDGRNLFELLPIESLALDAGHGERGELTVRLTLDLIGLTATPLRARLSDEDLLVLAAAHGYALRPLAREVAQ